MTYADGFIISMIGLSALFSWLRGFSREVMTLIAIGLGAAAIYFFGPNVSGILGEGALKSIIALVLLFGLIFVAASIAMEIVFATVVGPKPQTWDKISGAIFGLLRGWLIIGLAYVTSTFYFTEDNMPAPIANATLLGVATSAADLWGHLGIDKEFTDDESSDIPTSEQ